MTCVHVRLLGNSQLWIAGQNGHTPKRPHIITVVRMATHKTATHNNTTMFASSARLLSLTTIRKRATFITRLTAELATNTKCAGSSEVKSAIKPLAPFLFHYDVKSDHNGSAFTLRRTCSLQPTPDKNLSSVFEDLTINASPNPENILNHKKQEYILPALSGSVQKKILDPEIVQPHYELPTYCSRVKEKLTPGLESFAPKIDPSHLQKVINEGSLPLVKISMPYLLRIRRHKMKKHKLKKFRKRMIFLHRKLAEIKKRKKEQQLVEYKQKWEKRAAEFNPEKQLEDQLLLARKGGYGVPLFPGKSTR